MPRYILIDRNSGYIFGDTADYAVGTATGDIDPISAAKQLDASINEPEHAYREVDRHDASVSYDVYRADINGSDAVPVVYDGQDSDTIASVESDCRYITSLARYVPERSEPEHGGIERKSWMTPQEVRQAREALGRLWDKREEPVSNARLARSLRLGGRDPGLNAVNWQNGKTAVTGPVSLLIAMYLRGNKPIDGIPKGGPLRGAEHHWSNANPRNRGK